MIPGRSYQQILEPVPENGSIGDGRCVLMRPNISSPISIRLNRWGIMIYPLKPTEDLRCNT